MLPFKLLVAAVTTAAVVVIEPIVGATQARPNPARDDAVLVVDGVVREVFSSRTSRPARLDCPDRGEAVRGRSLAANGFASACARARRHGLRARVAARDRARGLQGSGDAPPADRDATALAVPAERAQVRAFLGPRSSGGWEGCGAPWFDMTSRELAEPTPADPPPGAADCALGLPGNMPQTAPDSTAAGKSALHALGLTCEGTTVQGKSVVRVSSVEPGGPSGARPRTR